MEKDKDHIIICNWNDKAEKIIDELLKCQPKNPYKIVAISREITDEKIKEKLDAAKKKYQSNEWVEFKTDNPCEKDIWDTINVHAAKSIILLADKNSSSPDYRNIEIALMIQKTYKELKNGVSVKPHIVAEMIDSSLSKHLKNAGVDEIISASNFRVGLISQSAIAAGIANVYSNLLQYSDDTNEIYFIQEYPESYIGKTFTELITLVRESAKSSDQQPLLLLGIIKGYKASDIKLTESSKKLINLNPAPDMKLTANDALVVMAYNFIDKIVAPEDDKNSTEDSE